MKQSKQQERHNQMSKLLDIAHDLEDPQLTEEKLTNALEALVLELASISRMLDQKILEKQNAE